MVANGVSAYFHGHDHQYVYEMRDGIVYQEVPSPSMTGSGFSGIYTQGDHGSYQTIKMLPNAGHLRVTVTPEQATVDYVATGGSVNYSYTVDAPLPITLGIFTAEVNTAGPGVKLDWTTVSEVNNYGFHVQRREGSVGTFADLPNSFVPGHGSTLQAQTYSFVDNTLEKVGQYSYRLRQVDLDGTEHFTQAVSAEVTIISVKEVALIEFKVSQNYPNPFNPSTNVKYELPTSSMVRLSVYDILGREVAVLVYDRRNAGVHEVKFDGSNLASGVYFYKLQAGNFLQTRKLLLLR
jgi:hypothetical protein